MKIVHYARGMSESSCRGTINELKVFSRLAGEVSSPPFLLQPYVEDELWAWRSAGEYLHIVTELCTGGDLSCYQYRLSDLTLSLICAEVILGLDHLHRLGIVHHDIKPQNILVNGHGHCVISDYGGAQFLDASQRIHRKTQRNMAVMTIPFAAPEVLSENDSVYKTYDRAVDYWALGATLVSLIMDDDYLPGTQDIAMIMFRLRRIEKKMKALSVSEKLQHFIMALLDQSPSRRPKYPEVAELPFLHDINWEEVQSLHCPPFDYVKEVGVLAHGFSIPTARVHETRAPVDFLHRLRHEQLSLVVDDSYDVAAHRTALEADL
ncbi:kinase-like protein [Lenzites betulinus]|nr:kinase-like protein [Lenzites betulinus]